MLANLKKDPFRSEQASSFDSARLFFFEMGIILLMCTVRLISYLSQGASGLGPCFFGLFFVGCFRFLLFMVLWAGFTRIDLESRKPGGKIYCAGLQWFLLSGSFICFVGLYVFYQVFHLGLLEGVDRDFTVIMDAVYSKSILLGLFLVRKVLFKGLFFAGVCRRYFLLGKRSYRGTVERAVFFLFGVVLVIGVLLLLFVCIFGILPSWGV